MFQICKRAGDNCQELQSISPYIQNSNFLYLQANTSTCHKLVDAKRRHLRLLGQRQRENILFFMVQEESWVSCLYEFPLPSKPHWGPYGMTQIDTAQIVVLHHNWKTTSSFKTQIYNKDVSQRETLSLLSRSDNKSDLCPGKWHQLCFQRLKRYVKQMAKQKIQDTQNLKRITEGCLPTSQCHFTSRYAYQIGRWGKQSSKYLIFLQFPFPLVQLLM